MAPILDWRLPARDAPLLGSVSKFTGSAPEPATRRPHSTARLPMTALSRRSFLLTGGVTAAGAVLFAPTAQAATARAGTARGGAASGIHVAAGQTYTVTATTRVRAVTIEPGGVLTAPTGHSLTMTVNGT